MEMSDGTVAPEEASPTGDVFDGGAPGPDAAAGETPAPQSTGINPAWEPLREAIGEDFFQTHAMPILKGMDESAHTRITNLNTQLKGFDGYKPFVEQGISPDDLQMAMQLRQLVETDAEGFYRMLGTHLGLDQQEQDSLDNYGADQDGVGEVPPHILARLEQQENFQRQIIEQAQQQVIEQQQAQAIEQEGAALDAEMSTFLKNNPTFTEEDKGELFRAQYELTMRLQNQGLNRLATLDEAAAEVTQRANYYNQRFGRGAGAPNTLPTTAGGNIPAQQPNAAKMSKQDFQDLIANDLFAAKANQS